MNVVENVVCNREREREGISLQAVSIYTCFEILIFEMQWLKREKTQQEEKIMHQ